MNKSESKQFNELIENAMTLTIIIETLREDNPKRFAETLLTLEENIKTNKGNIPAAYEVMGIFLLKKYGANKVGSICPFPFQCNKYDSCREINCCIEKPHSE